MNHDRRPGTASCEISCGWPVILEVLERIEFDFDDNGEPQLPSRISHKDISEVVPSAPANVGV